MEHAHPSSGESGAQRPPALQRLALLVFLGVAAFYLWTEHRAHLLGVLPYLVFLLCPLMHLLHGGHGGHGGHDRRGAEREENPKADGESEDRR